MAKRETGCRFGFPAALGFEHTACSVLFLVLLLQASLQGVAPGGCHAAGKTSPLLPTSEPHSLGWCLCVLPRRSKKRDRMPFTAIPSAVVLRWDLSTLGFEHCRLLGLNCGVLLQASCTLSAQSRLSTALLGSARDCDSASDFIFTFGVGSGPVLPVFGPVGFRPRPRSISPDDNLQGNQEPKCISAFGNQISLYDPYFHFTSLFTTYCMYYIYISTFI
jgi:hypothetical protein